MRRIALAKRESLTKGSVLTESRSIWGMVKSFTISTSTESEKLCSQIVLNVFIINKAEVSETA